MATFARVTTATRSRVGTRDRRGRFLKSTGVIVEGADVVADRFALKARTIRPLAGAAAVEHARKAAALMRSDVNVRLGHVQESITSTDATETDTGVYADAGPTHFVARFLEFGTAKTPPFPFVRPAADQVLAEFRDAIRRLA